MLRLHKNEKTPSVLTPLLPAARHSSRALPVQRLYPLYSICVVFALWLHSSVCTCVIYVSSPTNIVDSFYPADLPSDNNKSVVTSLG